MLNFSVIRSTTCSLLICALISLFGVFVTAAEQINPKPCKDPYECVDKPKFDGTPSGPTKLCPGQEGTWKCEEKFTPGYKKRCEEDPVKIDKTSTVWSHEVSGPEAYTGCGCGNEFTASFSTPGTYTITFEGDVYLDDYTTCGDIAKITRTYSFEVADDKPKFTVELSIDPSSLCPGETAKATGTFTDTSDCDPGSYVVKWRIENDGGGVLLKMKPEKGEVTLTQGATKEVEITITIDGKATGGISSFTLYGESDEATESGTDDLWTVEILSLSHTAPEYQPWTAGAQIAATATIEGELGDKEILYEAINVHSGAVGGSISVADTSASVPIKEPGRYRLQATLCDKTVVAPKIFVLWTATITPTSTTIKWDDFTDVINPDQWSNVERTKKLMMDALSVAVDGVKEAEEKLFPASTKEVQSAINEFIALQAQIDERLIRLEGEITELDNKLKDLNASKNSIEFDIRQKDAILKLEKAQLDTLAQSLNFWEGILKDPNISSEVRAQAILQTQTISAQIQVQKATVNQLTVEKQILITDLNRVKENILKTEADKVSVKEKLVQTKQAKTTSKKLIANMQSLPTDADLGKTGKSILKSLRAGAELLGPIGFILDVNDAVNAYGSWKDAVDKANRDLATANKYLKDNVKAFENWEKSKVKRLSSPQRVKMTIETIPGNLEMKLLEIPSFDKTKDPTIPNSETPFNHFSFISGLRDGWETAPSRPKSSPGAKGKASITLHLFGNLGKSTIVVQVKNQSHNGLTATINSAGKTEQELREILNQQVSAAKQAWDAFKRDADALLAVLAGTAAVISIVFTVLAVATTLAFAPAVALVAGIVATVAGVFTLIIGITDWIIGTASPSESSIQTLFPES